LGGTGGNGATRGGNGGHYNINDPTLSFSCGGGGGGGGYGYSGNTGVNGNSNEGIIGTKANSIVSTGIKITPGQSYPIIVGDDGFVTISWESK
jgi:hypothetical protein